MIYKNLHTKELLDISVKKEESILNNNGALCTFTGKHTGRSPNAKKIVKDETTINTVCWDNNSDISQDEFDSLHNKLI